MMGMTRWRAALRRVWVTFDGAGGTASVAAMRTGLDGKLATLPTATRDNYELAGWFLADGTQVTTETVFTADTTVTARWTANTVTVTVTGRFSATDSYLTINGQTVKTEGTYAAPIGDVIECCAASDTSRISGKIYLNGEVVESGWPARYGYTVKQNTPVLISLDEAAYVIQWYGKISITEEGS